MLEDFTVIKVMLSAIVVGMIGVFGLFSLGLAKRHIKPTRYAANILGGLMFGIGFALLAYCPGTGAAALGQGNFDALAGVLGLMAGSYLYAESSGLLGRTVLKWGDRGKLTLPQVVRVSPATFGIVFASILVAVLVFVERIAVRRNRDIASAREAMKENSMSVTRRKLLMLLGIAAGALSWPLRRAFAASPQTPKGSRMTFTILHTNDIHGHLTHWQGWNGDLKGKTVGGLVRLAGAVAQARKEAGEGVLLLDAGDLLGDTMIADLTHGKALIAALNHLGYDALTVGNHEPDFGTEALRERMGEAKFPTVAANLVERKGGKLFTKPYVLEKVGGVSVGVLGLAYPKTAWTTAAKNVAEVEFQDPVRAVKTYLPKMRADGAEVAIVLSHLGLGGDKHLARSVEGIDVIVGGHSHNRMAKAEQVGATLIVQAGAHGSDLGRLDLTVERGKITDHRRTLVPLDHDTVPADAEAERLVEELLEPHRKTLAEVIGKASNWLVRAQTLAGQDARKRDAESPIDSLFADILREVTKADIALLPGVGYGVAVPPGAVTAAQLRQLVPHEGKVVTMRLSGAQVIEVLEQAVENTFTNDPGAKVGGMIQVGGIRFRYDPALTKGRRVWHVERAGRKWESSAEYTVVTNSMLAGGGHNYRTLTKGEERAEHGSQYETIRRWFEKNSPVTTPPIGRIEKGS